MKEEIDLENFCPWDWIRKKTEATLKDELKKAMREEIIRSKTHSNSEKDINRY